MNTTHLFDSINKSFSWLFGKHSQSIFQTLRIFVLLGNFLVWIRQFNR